MELLKASSSIFLEEEYDRWIYGYILHQKFIYIGLQLTKEEKVRKNNEQ